MALPRTTNPRPKPTPKRPLPTSKAKPTPKPIPKPIPKPKYQAKIARMWHPDQSVYVDVSEPVELILDSWLECQIQAGLIIEVS